MKKKNNNIQTINIPDKLYFKIGEVSKITGVKPYVLRYWESEFSVIRPGKSKSNQRLYRRKDVELLLTIKNLLYSENFTIAGAKRKLRALSGDEKIELAEKECKPMDDGFLQEIYDNVKVLYDKVSDIDTEKESEI